jgi:predicted secreted protein
MEIYSTMPTTVVHAYGRDVIIKISDGAPTTPVFTAIGGQTTISKKVSSDKIDFSSKDDGRIKSSGFGQQEVTFSLAGKLKIPDVGFSKLQTVSNASPPEIDIQICRGTIILYAGTIGVGNLSWDAAVNGAVNYTADLTAVALPTTDDVTATV